MRFGTVATVNASGRTPLAIFRHQTGVKTGVPAKARGE